jgi:hypothetical protein
MGNHIKQLKADGLKRESERKIERFGGKGSNLLVAIDNEYPKYSVEYPKTCQKEKAGTE